MPQPPNTGSNFAQRLSLRLQAPVNVTLTSNGRTMLSWRHVDGSFFVRIHRIFDRAPAPVVDAVARTIRASGGRRDEVFAKYIESHRREISAKKKKTRIRTKGRWHNLETILNELNTRLLDGRFKGRITWGRRPPNRRRHSIRLGSYLPEERLIRINPALDQDFVPSYVVEWIVFHEMLHQLVAMPRRGRRRQCHTAQFRALEASFPHHDKAKLWEKANLGRLLRA